MSIATQIERIRNEVNTQGDLIAQITAALKDKAGATAITINFSIDSISYQATLGMSWRDWVNSQYNTNDFSIDTSLDAVVGRDFYPVVYTLSNYAKQNVSLGQFIWPGYMYNFGPYSTQ